MYFISEMSDLNDQLRQILENLGEKPPRSRLAPYREFIVKLLQRKYTYRDIQRILREKCQIQVSISALHGFVRAHGKPELITSVRSAGSKHPKPRKQSSRERTPVPLMSKSPPPAGKPDEIRQRIAALKKQAPQTGSNIKRFEYDPDQPLHLVTEGEKT